MHKCLYNSYQNTLSDVRTIQNNNYLLSYIRHKYTIHMYSILYIPITVSVLITFDWSLFHPFIPKPKLLKIHYNKYIFINNVLNYAYLSLSFQQKQSVTKVKKSSWNLGTTLREFNLLLCNLTSVDGGCLTTTHRTLLARECVASSHAPPRRTFSSLFFSFVSLFLVHLRKHVSSLSSSGAVNLYSVHLYSDQHQAP